METWTNDISYASAKLRRDELASGQVAFFVVPVRSGRELDPLPVPAEALADLAKVFTDGGSFLAAALSHMPMAWESLGGLHRSFDSLAEALKLREELGHAEFPPSSWKGPRL